MKPYKLDCFDWNTAHVVFRVFDPKGVNCGTVTVETEDVINFVTKSWGGHLCWNGLMPLEFANRRIDEIDKQVRERAADRIKGGPET